MFTSSVGWVQRRKIFDDTGLVWEDFVASPDARPAMEEILNVPFVWSSIDRAAIEEALGRCLAALDQAKRPVRWFDSFAAAHAHVSGKAYAASRNRSKAFGDSGSKGAASDPGATDDEWDEARCAACSRKWKEAQRAAKEAATLEAQQRVSQQKSSWNWRALRRALVWRSRLATDARQDAMTRVLEVATAAEHDRSRSSAQEDAWRRARQAASAACEDAGGLARSSVILEHARANPNAIAGRNAFAALRRAYGRGLWAFWVRDEEIICVPPPNLHTDERGRLHRTDGPTIEWPGDVYWFTQRPAGEYRYSIAERLVGVVLIGIAMVFFTCVWACRSLLKAVLAPFVGRSN